MNNKPNSPKDQPQNEIDLFDVFSAIGRGIRRFFKAIIDAFFFLFVFGIRRIHWLALFGLAGAGFGYLYNSLTMQYYSSEMIVQPNGFTSIDMADYINDIHAFCVEGNKEGLQSAFQISPEAAKGIKNIAAFFYIDVNKDGIGDHVDYKFKYNPEDTTTTIIRNRLLIRAEVYDNVFFQEVRTGLLNYINSNPYLIAVNDIRKEELHALIEQADQEIEKLDSLQNYEYYKTPVERQGQTREGQLVFMNEKPTQLYYQDKVSLLNRKLQYQRLLELSTKPITIIKDFRTVEYEENPPLKSIIYGIFFFVLSGYIILLIITYWHKIKSFLSAY